jgi:hypothetical protein
MTKHKRVAARCGRRWGKNVFGESVAADDALKGRYTGWGAPERKRMTESYNTVMELLHDVVKNSNKTDGVIRTITGGRIDFWSLEDEDAGRSRKYHRFIIDEGAFTKPKIAIETLERAIAPTLLDYDGSMLVMSNTKGIDPDNLMYAICHDKRFGFVDFHAPTTSNPFLPEKKVHETPEAFMIRRTAYFDDLKAKTPPLVYQQEYLAEFVDWSGDAFFARERFLVNDQPVDMPMRCEAVFAVIDTATKTGKDHDGTAVVYFALLRNHIRPVGPDGKLGPEHHLIILDWDISQIEGALLETWLPNVFRQLQHYALSCKARMGSLGTMIEDKASGMVLIQQAVRHGWPATAIDSKLTSLGKDERAISVSGYVYRGMVKIARVAYDKVVTYKESTGNHLLMQLVGFRIGAKDAGRADDLLDSAVYGMVISLGNEEGF